jgi:hypothetical protein
MSLIPVPVVTLLLSKELEKQNEGPYCYECAVSWDPHDTLVEGHEFKAGCYHPASAIIDQMGPANFFCGDCRSWYFAELVEDGETFLILC